MKLEKARLSLAIAVQVLAIIATANKIRETAVALKAL